MSSVLFRATLGLFLLARVAAVEPLPAPDAILKNLKPDHPRLILDGAKIDEIRALVERDATAKRIFAGIRESADKALVAKPPVHELRDGRRMIYVSNEVLARVRDLAFMHMMTGERKYADRAWVDLEAAAKFKDWNPDHFLDTAIMTKAFAIGLDWLWDEWAPTQRETLRQAIVEKGLRPAMKTYEGGGWWAKATNNWNQVCNGGIGMGALAVADTDPELAGTIIRHAVENMPIALSEYAPDGAGYEGPGYWGFGSLSSPRWRPRWATTSASRTPTASARAAITRSISPARNATPSTSATATPSPPRPRSTFGWGNASASPFTPGSAARRFPATGTPASGI